MDINVLHAENLDYPHILLVDDNPVKLEQMAVSLEHRGYFVTCSTTCFEADVLLKEYPDIFDAVLVDHCAPGIRRIDSTISSTRINDNTPVVLHIDMDYFVEENRLSQIGLEDTAIDPFTIDDLGSVLKKVINEKVEVCL